MANVGNAHYEYDGGNTRGDNDSPDSPLVTAAGIGNSVERNGDAALDEDGARGVEKFGDEKVLLPGISFAIFEWLSRRAKAHTLVPCMISLLLRLTAS
jgi:hypothetical protein